MRTWLLAFLCSALLASPASAVTVEWVAVGDPGNAADTPPSNCYAASCGSVSYSYYISKYEVTNAQYAEFLNAKAASDALELYHTYMSGQWGGITRSSASGSYTYSAKAGWENKPVNVVSFFDAMRFSNWLHNGQGSGDTETGAYTLLGGTETPSNWTTVTRNEGATIFLTSENEWYKAAYYDALSASFFDYPAGTNAVTTCAAPGAAANTASCYPGVENATDVGAYTGSASPYGTFDQGGNVWEWNDQIALGSYRGVRGGGWSENASSLAASNRNASGPAYQNYSLGFRVASPIPEPGMGLLFTSAVINLALLRKRTAKVL
jgi:formylglycine-generating enzyme required for sulfatase activity